MIMSPLLRSGKSEAQTLTGEAVCLRETQDGRRLLLLDANALIAHCLEYPDTIRRRWEAFQQEVEGRVLFEDDMAPSFTMLISLAETCREAVAAVRESLEAAERSRPDLERQDERAYPAPHLAPLESAASRLAALRSEISAQWEWLNAPAEPHRPLRTTEEIQAGLRRGEYISVEDAMAQATENLPEAP
jgi:hypothetical protein